MDQLGTGRFNRLQNDTFTSKNLLLIIAIMQEHEMIVPHFQHVESPFKRCLVDSLVLQRPSDGDLPCQERGVRVHLIGSPEAEIAQDGAVFAVER